MKAMDEDGREHIHSKAWNYSWKRFPVDMRGCGGGQGYEKRCIKGV